MRWILIVEDPHDPKEFPITAAALMSDLEDVLLDNDCSLVAVINPVNVLDCRIVNWQPPQDTEKKDSSNSVQPSDKE